MARYFYAWIPFVALSGILFLIVPFLGLITAAVFAAGAVAAFGLLVWRIVAAVRAFVVSVLTRLPRDVGRARAQAQSPAAQTQTVMAHRS